jgi:peptide-methionine (S)-S-oxide reductase
MTLRSLASSLGIAAALCLTTGARAQDPGKSAPTEPKAKAAGEAKKAGDPETPKADEPKAKSEAKAEKVEPKLEKAVFGGGCFWCLEAFFERVHGVKAVVSGYAGGNVPKPSYELVCTGLTGHAEVVAIEYDANIVTYDDLLDIFWICHDPTTLNRQGPDEGTQYRSIILAVNEDQRKIAEKSRQKAATSGYFSSPIVTELVPLERFWPAERYHQDYYRRNANKNPYCQTVIAPKIEELRAKLNSRAPKPKSQSKPQ